jgi:hypothetical protein
MRPVLSCSTSGSMPSSRYWYHISQSPPSPSGGSTRGMPRLSTSLPMGSRRLSELMIRPLNMSSAEARSSCRCCLTKKRGGARKLAAICSAQSHASSPSSFSISSAAVGHDVTV